MSRKLLMLIGGTSLVLVLGGLPFLAFCAQPALAQAPAQAPATAAAKTIVLKAAAFQPKNISAVAGARIWVEMINEAAKGKLMVDYLGGPEVIGGMEQVEAVRNGVIDISFNTAGYYERAMPAAMILQISTLSPDQERKSGLYEIMLPLHKNMGLFWPGRTFPGSTFRIFLNKKIDSPKQLAGLKIRTAPAFDPFMKALGIATVSLSPPEIYTAMERHVIDGFFNPSVGFTDYAFQEVAKYGIDHGFYADNQTIIMNLAAWNRLPKNLQDLIMDVQINKFEPRMLTYVQEATKIERDKMAKAGMQWITFSKEDADYYVGTAYNVKWSELKTKVSPEMYTELRKAIGVQ